MRKTLRLLVTMTIPLCVACGGGEHSTTTSGGMGGHAMTGTGGTGGHAMTGSVPDPGTSDQVDNDFTNVEPNNTPEQATPLGVAAGADVNVWVNGNAIGGASNPTDYFVFKSNATAGQFTFDVCFGAPITAMTATLSKVVGGEEQTPPVGTWSSAMGCVTDNMTPAALEASTVYLFGLTATGGVGMYGA